MGKTNIYWILAVTLVIAFVQSGQGSEPIDPVISYQGLLEDGAGPANGQYDLSFTLFDDPIAGFPMGNTVFLEDVEVVDGLISVELAFDREIYNGTQPWMEVLVRPGASTNPGDYVVLGPRQKINPSPYAMYSLSSGIVRSGISELPLDPVDGKLEARLGFVPFGYSFPEPPTVTVTGVESPSDQIPVIPRIGTITTDGFELYAQVPDLKNTNGTNYRFTWIAAQQGGQINTWYKDSDGDGYSDGTIDSGVTPPSGYFAASDLVSVTGDCNDSDSKIHPGANEKWYDGIDQDCDGLSDYDYDQDGYDVDFHGGTDCDDLNRFVHPNAMELCNGVDDDCDGAVDDNCVDRSCSDGMVEAFFAYLANCGGNSQSCIAEAATLFAGTPCEDAILSLLGCSGFSDLCLALGSWECFFYQCPAEYSSVFGAPEDKDEDGFNTLDDCDDGNATVYPGAAEIWYDGVDQDCDGRSDYDQDQDGFDSAAHGGNDCDDTDASIYPGALESCGDGIDQDCDGIDETCRDADKDGFLSDVDCHDLDPSINPGAAEIWYDGVDQDCDGADDYDQDADGYQGVLNGDGDLDCDDTNPDIHPGATEIWYDGIDQDCDGADDYDQDGDGFKGVLLEDGDLDCDDTDPEVYPGAPEIWYDGVDQDCDGLSDYDQDRDGYDSDAYGGTDCDDTNPSINPADYDGDGYSLCDGDCDDGDPSINPADYDGDGYSLCDGDCDDGDPRTNPGAVEIWYDGVDQDCDGWSDYDQDRDGFDRIPEGADPDDTNPDVIPI